MVESLLFFGGLLLLGYVLYAMVKLGGKSVPKDNSGPSKDSFLRKLPEGYGYEHVCDGRGYAVNPVENKFALYANDMVIYYDISQLRDVRKEWYSPEQYRMVGGKLLPAPGVALKNAIDKASMNKDAKREAWEASGLTLTLADINMPTFLIHFGSSAALDRSFEIFSQFTEGILPPPPSRAKIAEQTKEKAKEKSKKNKQAAMQWVMILLGIGGLIFFFGDIQ